MEDRIMRINVSNEVYFLKLSAAQKHFGIQGTNLDQFASDDNPYLAVSKVRKVAESAKEYALTKKYAILCDAIDKSLSTCTIQSLTRTRVEADLTGKTEGKAGRYFYDEIHNQIIISDAITTTAFKVNSNMSKDPSRFMSTRMLRNMYGDIGRDGRQYLHLFLSDKNAYTADKSVLVLTYACCLLMWDEDTRVKLEKMLLDETAKPSMMVVNHCNNDSRNCALYNLELVTNVENLAHGAMVQYIWDNPRFAEFRGEEYVIANNTGTKVKKTLNFCLRAKAFTSIDDVTLTSLRFEKRDRDTCKFTEFQIIETAKNVARKIQENFKLSDEYCIPAAAEHVRAIIRHPERWMPAEILDKDILPYIYENIEDFAYDAFYRDLTGYME